MAEGARTGPHRQGYAAPRTSGQREGSCGYRAYADTLELAAAYRDLVSRLGAHGGKGLDVEIEVNGLLTYDRAVVTLPPEAAQCNRRV